MKVKLSIAVVLVALVAAITASPAVARNPRPDCAPPAKPHCPIHYVSYSYWQRGHDQFGNQYVRLCHVPAHHKRWCGPWKALPVLRTAFPVHHATKADLRRLFPKP